MTAKNNKADIDEVKEESAEPEIKEKKHGRLKKLLKKTISTEIWQRGLKCALYFALIMILINDVVILVGRNYFPNFFHDGHVLLLDKLAHNLLTVITGAFGL